MNSVSEAVRIYMVVCQQTFETGHDKKLQTAKSGPFLQR